MTIYEISKMRKSRGFTMIELMLVMAIAAVMMSLKMQDDKLEMTQLQARKLGGTELFVYNLGVQKYISKLSGVVPATGAYPQIYTGVDWLKSDECTAATPPADPTPHHVPCSFLRSSGGRTTMGAMSFTTTIDYDSATGYTARTVLSQMAGTAGTENNSGVLGMAALVASGAFIGSDASATSGGSGGSIIYCPDINPMPAGMAATCGAARDQIVMIVNTNGNDDQWLRVDHGNMMRHVIEMSEDVNASPAIDDDLDDVHPNMRQIRNVARIYNMGASGNENLYIGSRTGVAALGQATLANNAVIIDANQEILGLLKVQGDIQSDGGNITATDDPLTAAAEGNIIAENDIQSLSGNATINGWIRATNGNIQADTGDIIADSGIVRAHSFVDATDTNYDVNPNSVSNMNVIDVYNLRANLDRSSIMHMRADRIDVRSRGGSRAYLTGNFRVAPNTMVIRKNGRDYYIEDLIPNMTYLGSGIAQHGYGYRIYTGAWASQCPYWRIKVYASSMSETLMTRARQVWEGWDASRQYGRIGRWVTQSGYNFYYYQRSMVDNDGGYGSGYDNGARAVLQFYCDR